MKCCSIGDVYYTADGIKGKVTAIQSDGNVVLQISSSRIERIYNPNILFKSEQLARIFNNLLSKLQNKLLSDFHKKDSGIEKIEECKNSENLLLKIIFVNGKVAYIGCDDNNFFVKELDTGEVIICHTDTEIFDILNNIL